MFPILTNRYSRVPSSVSAAAPVDWVDREFGRMMRQFWGDGNGHSNTVPTISYPMNIWETEDAFHVEAEMPGFKRDEVEITMESGTLCIVAQRRQQVDNTSEHNGEANETTNGDTPLQRHHHVRERRYARYERSFSMPTTIDEDQIQARLEDGVLHLTLPKRAEVKPRKIQVN
jgi:HSP20 family protein